MPESKTNRAIVIAGQLDHQTQVGLNQAVCDLRAAGPVVLVGQGTLFIRGQWLLERPGKERGPVSRRAPGLELHDGPDQLQAEDQSAGQRFRSENRLNQW